MTTPHDSAPGGYEKSDVRPKAILISGVVLAVVTILVFVHVHREVRADSAPLGIDNSRLLQPARGFPGPLNRPG